MCEGDRISPQEKAVYVANFGAARLGRDGRLAMGWRDDRGGDHQRQDRGKTCKEPRACSHRCDSCKPQLIVAYQASGVSAVSRRHSQAGQATSATASSAHERREQCLPAGWSVTGGTNSCWRIGQLTGWCTHNLFATHRKKLLSVWSSDSSPAPFDHTARPPGCLQILHH